MERRTRLKEALKEIWTGLAVASISMELNSSADRSERYDERNDTQSRIAERKRNGLARTVKMG